MSDYRKGFRDGWMAAREAAQEAVGRGFIDIDKPSDADIAFSRGRFPASDWPQKPKRKRKLSDWQKYVKVNSKKPRFKYKSGSKKGRVNFKALGVAFRKTPAGKKKRR